MDLNPQSLLQNQTIGNQSPRSGRRPTAMPLQQTGTGMSQNDMPIPTPFTQAASNSLPLSMGNTSSLISSVQQPVLGSSLVSSSLYSSLPSSLPVATLGSARSTLVTSQPLITSSLSQRSFLSQQSSLSQRSSLSPVSSLSPAVLLSQQSSVIPLSSPSSSPVARPLSSATPIVSTIPLSSSSLVSPRGPSPVTSLSPAALLSQQSTVRPVSPGRSALDPLVPTLVVSSMDGSMMGGDTMMGNGMGEMSDEEMSDEEGEATPIVLEEPRANFDMPEDEMADLMRSEMGDVEQLATFFDRYRNHERMSEKCALDGRYFWKVLVVYEGLVNSEIYIRINQGAHVQDPENGLVREFKAQISFDPSELERVMGSSKRYRLIKIILDISDNAESNTGSVHSNLLYIDTAEREAVRFEPMVEPYYTEIVDKLLEGYLKPLLPEGYTYRSLPDHPQLPMTDACPSKGMCAAYVLKKAMMLVTRNDRAMDGEHEAEEMKIMKFADAIETEYGELPNPELAESGVGIGFSTEYGHPYLHGHGHHHHKGRFDPYKYGFGNTYVDPYAYPAVTPAVYPGLGMYSPEYYGYGWGPRESRPPGYSWGTKRWQHYGDWSHEYGPYTKAKEKVGKAYEKALKHARGAKEKAQEKLGVIKEKLGVAGGKAKEKLGISKLQRERESRQQSEQLLKERLANPRDTEKELDELQRLIDQPKARKVLGARGATEYGDSEDSISREYGWNHDPEKEYGHRCGCEGCKTAPPREEQGYWHRDEHGRDWKPMVYGGALLGGADVGAGATVHDQNVARGRFTEYERERAEKEIRKQGQRFKPEYGGDEYGHDSSCKGEFGCGCGGGKSSLGSSKSSMGEYGKGGGGHRGGGGGHRGGGGGWGGHRGGGGWGGHRGGHHRGGRGWRGRHHHHGHRGPGLLGLLFGGYRRPYYCDPYYDPYCSGSYYEYGLSQPDQEYGRHHHENPGLLGSLFGTGHHHDHHGHHHDHKRHHYPKRRWHRGYGWHGKGRWEYGWDPRTWSPTQKTIGAGVLGAVGGGLLTGSLSGALIGGGLGAGAGYLLTRPSSRPAYPGPYASPQYASPQYASSQYAPQQYTTPPNQYARPPMDRYYYSGY